MNSRHLRFLFISNGLMINSYKIKMAIKAVYNIYKALKSTKIPNIPTQSGWSDGVMWEELESGKRPECKTKKEAL